MARRPRPPAVPNTAPALDPTPPPNLDLALALLQRLQDRARDALLLGVARADILLLNDQVEVILVLRETGMAAVTSTEKH
jgi:hypothetical protein